MMFLSETASKFPHVVEYVQNRLQPGVLKSVAPKTWAAFLRACDDAPVATEALTRTSGPIVKVVDGMIRGAGQVACGLYPRMRSFQLATQINQIWITDVFMYAYERCGLPEKDKNARRVESTLLHECVHWARQKANKTDEISLPDNLPPHEAGEIFEQWAYGKLGCNDDDLWDALLSFRDWS
jgi:hypothetical protein